MAQDFLADHDLAVFFLVVSVVLGGLVIGGLGRLVVPGPNPMGCLGTVGVGLIGAVVGGAVARAFYADPGRHALVTLLLEVAAAATAVALISGRRAR